MKGQPIDSLLSYVESNIEYFDRVNNRTLLIIISISKKMTYYRNFNDARKQLERSECSLVFL